MAHVTEPHPQSARHPNLVLIGYRATGKTSIGARLAEELQRPFVDLDQVLVREAGRSVAEIVAQGGWAEFRRLEKQLVARYRDARGLVLATGGGFVLDPDNVAALRKNGIIIWLTADPAAIQARLFQDQPRDANRPSLTGGDTIREVAAVAEERAPLYQAAAQISINTTHRSVAQVVKLVLAALKSEEAKNLGG
ncbi:MAG: shikimate kinase [Proteobacteria bacterium]|nr:shikimate kinase [Pseudomonadota bacterium]MBU4354263.1 shikimate kinase [Pseudomonadota bacterium]MBU4448991.1 shikimate kinase [Pseudomonadota bacterium]MCG2771658.1 shikimate kinase [Desulfobacterales bacterium]